MLAHVLPASLNLTQVPEPGTTPSPQAGGPSLFSPSQLSTSSQDGALGAACGTQCHSAVEEIKAVPMKGLGKQNATGRRDGRGRSIR